MPQFQPKEIQKQIERNELWPVYWIYGQEVMKGRELVKRLRKVIVGEGSSLQEDRYDGAQISAAELVDAAKTLAFGGGPRFILISDAHLIKETDGLAELMGKPTKREKLDSVCIFISKDLDARKKFSKLLIAEAAAVPCEAVADQDREAWIQYLAKRHSLVIQNEWMTRLCAMDPWSLDLMEQEICKIALALPEDRSLVLQGSVTQDASGEDFAESFFTRKRAVALEQVSSIANDPESALPLLGLLAWNVRHLSLMKAGDSPRLNPYVASRLQQWSRHWSLRDLGELQSDLSEMDFSIKQTQRLSLGIWTTVVQKHCR